MSRAETKADIAYRRGIVAANDEREPLGSKMDELDISVEFQPLREEFRRVLQSEPMRRVIASTFLSELYQSEELELPREMGVPFPASDGSTYVVWFGEAEKGAVYLGRFGEGEYEPFYQALRNTIEEANYFLDEDDERIDEVAEWTIINPDLKDTTIVALYNWEFNLFSPEGTYYDTAQVADQVKDLIQGFIQEVDLRAQALEKQATSKPQTT